MLNKTIFFFGGGGGGGQVGMTLRWLNTVLRAVSGNLRGRACY